jgi:hypothetical protein
MPNSTMNHTLDVTEDHVQDLFTAYKELRDLIAHETGEIKDRLEGIEVSLNYGITNLLKGLPKAERQWEGIKRILR